MTFRDYLVNETKVEKEIINENDQTVLKIKLEDGDMIIKSIQMSTDSIYSEKFEHIITYNGTKIKFVTNGDYEAVEFNGKALDALTLFNHLIQQFYMNGIVKSKSS